MDSIASGSRQRALVTAVGMVASALALGPAAIAEAATFTVTKADDTADGSCDADCSLREAIIAANSAGGENTVIVPPGTYVITIAVATQENAAAEGDLDLTSNVTVQGAGPSQTIVDGNGSVTNDHVFQVLGPADAAISGLTITGGHATSLDGGRDDGGGVHVDDATPGAHLLLTDALVTGNTADDFAGGVDVDATATLRNVTVSGNTATDTGGAMEVEGGATLTNVTVSGNSALDDAGGIALFNDDPVFMNNLTVTGNTADSNNDNDGDGGGIFASDPGNTIANSIVAGNTDATSPPGSVHPDCSGAAPTNLTSVGHNLVGTFPPNCTFAAPGDLTGQDPLLGALADNGGPTPTHALLQGSPAIDAGDPATPGSGGSACEASDQRGVPRNCDIGAYELATCLSVVVNRVGTPGDDDLTGTEDADAFLLFAGNDRASGLGGNDVFCPAEGDDAMSGGDGNDTVEGSAGNDSMDGGGGNDSFDGGDGDDSGSGGEGDDTALGLAGNDAWSGDAGNDTYDGGDGNDSANGGDGNDRLKGANGKDRLKGANGKDRLKGGNGRDRLNGGKGKDKLNGGKSKDTCNGAAGKDKAKSCEKEKQIP